MNTRRTLSALGMLPILLAACGAPSMAAVTVPDYAVQPVAVQQSAPARTADFQNVDTLQATFEQIYEQVNPSVVNIDVTSQAAGSLRSGAVASALGSGFVWDEDGHIVTNAHVVADADQIRVTFADGSSAEAKLVGSDRYSDLAVIQVDVPQEDLIPVPLTDSDQVKVGSIAIAIGNPFGLQGTMTQGIVSALARTLSVDSNASLGSGTGSYSIPDIIQTDASINPGNSGGVLVDTEGRLIGVTSAIASSTQSNSGVGFVIPSNIVQKVVPALIANGEVQHSMLGISGTTLTPDLADAAGLSQDQRGVLVVTVASNGPADKAGLVSSERSANVGGQSIEVGGDVITAIDGQPVERFEDLVSYLFNHTEPQQAVTLTLLRDGKEQSVTLNLGALPALD